MLRSHALLASLLSLAVAGCSSSQQKTESSDTVQVASDTVVRKSGLERQMERSRMLAPRECRIAGTVVEIDQTLDTVAGAPCSKFPCKATVRIDSVLGTGENFLRVFRPGEAVAVIFGHTLAPTKEAMPDLGIALPGLKVGSRFQADVVERHSADKRDPYAAAQPQYIIFTYTEI
jgi:hypothetical protein